jgi:hypothetical protein
MSSREIARAILVTVVLAASPAHAQFGVPWRQTLTVTVIAAEGDHRLALVDEAVAFWNKTLEELGSGFRLGPITHVVRPIPEEALQELSRAVVEGPRPVKAPARCRPDAFQSMVPRIFPLTDDEKRALLRMYPPDWKPQSAVGGTHAAA